MRNYRCTLLAALLTLISIAGADCQVSRHLTGEDRYKSYLQFYTLVRGTTVRPHWYPDGSRFWFAGGSPDSSIIYSVDPLHNSKAELFDIPRLRNALRQVLGHQPANKGVPFADFEFSGTGKVSFTLESKVFLLTLKDYRLAPAKATEAMGQHLVSVRDHNLWLGGVRLTGDGIKDDEWSATDAAWSPDSSQLFVQKSDDRRVHHLPITDYSTPTEKVDFTHYAKTGGALQITGLFVIDVKTGRQQQIDAGQDTAQYIFPLGWRPDGTEVLFMRLSREGKKLELLAADPHSGISRIIVTEQQSTFVGVVRRKNLADRLDNFFR